MSINEIVNYVNRTPHNTNPNVIASMVQGANEQAVYESVEKLKQDGGVGYIEPAKVIGSVELNLIQEGTGTFVEDSVLISKFQALKEGETYVVKTDSGTFERVCGTLVDGIETISFVGNPKVFTGEDNGDSFFVGTTPFLDEPEFIGLVAVDYNFGSHIIVSEAETVHSIDPKYLPDMGSNSGGGAPVIDLTHLDFYKNDGVVELTLKDLENIAKIIGDAGFVAPLAVGINYGSYLCIACDVLYNPTENKIGLTGHIKVGTSTIELVINIEDLSGVVEISMSEQAGGGIPMVTLHTVPVLNSEEGVMLSTEDGAAMSEAAATGNPFVVRFGMPIGDNVTMDANMLVAQSRMYGSYVYIGSVWTKTAMFTNIPETTDWSFMLIDMSMAEQ